MIFQQLSIALGVISMIGFFASSGKQRRISAFLLALSLLMGIISFTALSPYSPHPPHPTEQSAEQEQVNPSPSPTPTPRATHRAIASGEVIVLDGNKNITIPEGRKSLCFSYLGIPGDKMSNQELNLGEEFFSEMGTVCKDISHLSGKVSVVMYPNDSWSSQQVRDWYRGWKNQPGGQGEFPIIRIGE